MQTGSSSKFRAFDPRPFTPVGINNHPRRESSASIDLGTCPNRVGVVDGGHSPPSLKYLLVGQRVWHGAFTPDEKYLLVTNGRFQ